LIELLPSSCISPAPANAGDARSEDSIDHNSGFFENESFEQSTVIDERGASRGLGRGIGADGREAVSASHPRPTPFIKGSV
jgi:hypothetical protein